MSEHPFGRRYVFCFAGAERVPSRRGSPGNVEGEDAVTEWDICGGRGARRGAEGTAVWEGLKDGLEDGGLRLVLRWVVGVGSVGFGGGPDARVAARVEVGILEEHCRCCLRYGYGRADGLVDMI